jgi:competence protein ComEC
MLAGVLLALWAPAAWSAMCGWLVLGVGAALAMTRWWRIAVLGTLGFFLAQHSAVRVLHAAFDCGERRLVVARIETIAAANEGGWQFDAWLSPARPPGFEPLRVRLSLRASVPPHVGERWRYLVQFPTPAEGERGASQARSLLRDHISATAMIRDSPLNQRLAAAAGSISKLRERVSQRIGERVADPSAAALLAALAVGVTGDVSAGQWRIFNATGITHLVAISGMHVTFFAMLCMAVARWAWRRWDWLATGCRRESFAAVTGAALAFAYALLSGFSVPAQRTAVMLTVFLLARGCGRITRPLWSVAASLVVVLLYDPLAVLSAGFWLSFCAVFAIVAFAGARLQPAGSLRGAAQVQWVVTAALLPVTVVLFGTFSAIGPLVNAAAIPLFTFALVPPVLIGTVFYLLPGYAALFIADHLVDLAAKAATIAWPVLTTCADFAAALWSAHAGLLWLCLAFPAAALLLLPVQPLLRGASAMLLLTAFVAHAPRPARGELQVDMFDVGASRAVLISTANHQLLAGTGEGFGTAGRRFETRILPTLLGSGEAGIDLWMLQKPDRDALRALTLGRARLAIGEIMVAESRGVPPELTTCAPREWLWDGVRFSITDEGGCWLRAKLGSQTLLLTPERASSAVAPPGGADIWILPRRAEEAGRMLNMAPFTPALLLVGGSATEWQAAPWRDLQAEQRLRGNSMRSTARGAIHVRMKSAAVAKVTQGDWWRPGIWSASRVDAQCRR